MEYGAYTTRTVDEAVDLTNLFAETSAETVDDGALRSILARYELPETPLDLAAYEALAEQLRAVFEAASDDERVARLNDLIAECQPEPQIVDHDDKGPHFHFVPDDAEDVRCVSASIAMALAYVLVDFGAARLGSCDAPDCRDVFVDSTRNARQRFCSKTCATRVHVAKHRARG